MTTINIKLTKLQAEMIQKVLLSANTDDLSLRGCVFNDDDMDLVVEMIQDKIEENS